MRFGVHLTHYRLKDAPEPAVGLALRAEALGYDSVWAGDHIVNPTVVNTIYPHDPPGVVKTASAPGGMPDPFVLLAVIGARTSRVRLGFDVLIVPYRPALLMAKSIATLDALLAGRTIVGVGAGWHEQEFAALSVPFRERNPRTDEAIAVWRAVWSGDPVTFDGRFDRFPELTMLPRPLQPGGPPIWVGGDGPLARRRAALLADGWIPTFYSADQYREEYAEIRALAESAGRPAPTAALQSKMKIVDRPVEPTAADLANPYRKLIGTPDEIIAAVRAYQAAGIEELVLSATSPDPSELPTLIERFAREIRPAVEG